MHVGDCRLYHLRSGKIAQITKDHTLVGERVRMGLLSAREARSHPERSALSRCLGRELIVSVDRISMPLRKDDAIILCSDGLYSVLEDHEIAELIAGADSESACRKLIEGANQRGTADNVTSVVFRLLEGGAVEVRTGLRARLQKLFRGWR
jgi:protein phosphatase